MEIIANGIGGEVDDHVADIDEWFMGSIEGIAAHEGDCGKCGDCANCADCGRCGNCATC